MFSAFTIASFTSSSMVEDPCLRSLSHKRSFVGISLKYTLYSSCTILDGDTLDKRTQPHHLHKLIWLLRFASLFRKLGISYNQLINPCSFKLRYLLSPMIKWSYSSIPHIVPVSFSFLVMSISF